MPDTLFSPGRSLRQHPDLVLEVLPRFHWWQFSGRGPGAGALLAGMLALESAPAVGELLIAGPVTVLGDGPGRWLIRQPREAAAPLAPAGGALTDLSDSLWGVCARGTLATELLACGCPLDLGGPDTPPPGGARSLFHHLPLLVLHTRAGSLDLLVPRSYRADFAHALTTAADHLLALAADRTGRP